MGNLFLIAYLSFASCAEFENLTESSSAPKHNSSPEEKSLSNLSVSKPNVRVNSSLEHKGHFLDIDIKTNERDCVEGSLSMDVEVKVNGEDFDFAPSCEFTFSDSFKTKTGVMCKIESGMCSSFSGRGELEVDCEGHNDKSIDILCTPEKVAINIDLDDDDCVNKNDSIDVTVYVANERFSFDPPCNASFWDEDFKTKLGVKCEIEADLCSSSSSGEGEIEVDCGRSEETKKVKCPEKKQ